MLLVAFAFLLPQNIFAADPDLSNYTVIKTFDFKNGFTDNTTLTQGDATGTKSYDTGNKKDQDLYNVTTPEELAGVLAVQAIGNGSGKGWWLRDGVGLYSYKAGRCAAIINLQKNQVVVFECSQDASNVMSLTNGSGEPDGPFTYVKSEDGKKFYCTMTEDGQIGFMGNNGKSAITTLTIYAPPADMKFANYTVKYVDMNGNALNKANRISEATVGTKPTLIDSDKAPIISEDGTKKFVYDSDDSENLTVAEDGSTVVTVKFHEATAMAYTVNAVNENGDIIETLVKGNAFEADEVTAPYKLYVNVNGTLYKKDPTNKEYNHRFTLTENEQTINLDYTATDITNVVYLAEGEQIEGTTKCTANNTTIRSSFSGSGYAADTDLVMTTLPNGKYKIHAVLFDASKEPDWTLNISAGDKKFDLHTNTVNWQEIDIEEFELNNASTNLILNAGGSDNKGLDFIYVVKTGDAELAAPVAAAGKMDFIAMNLPVSSGSGATPVTDGDITENKTFNADDFSVIISPSTTNTPNRFWSATVDGKKGSQLRIYGGTVTVEAVAGKTLNKIVFNHDSKTFSISNADCGMLEKDVWTGEATKVVFTMAKSFINSITVGEYVAPAEPVTDVANIAAFKALEAGTRAKLAVNGAKVTFAKDDNIYIEDETGALLLYKTGLTMTAGKAITGFINGAYTDYNGLAELTAIDVTPASEFTEADTEITATVVTVAEANTVENVSKLVKLENVNINADYQTITQGEDEIAFYDKFKVMGDYVYPAVAKSIVGIINTANGTNTFHPVSPDSIVAAEVSTPEAANIAAAKDAELRDKEIKLNVDGAKVTLFGGNNLAESFIEDETGAIMVDMNIGKLLGKDGVALKGFIIGKVTKDQRMGGVFKFESTENTASSEITTEETTIEPTTTTIAAIVDGMPADVTSKYYRLENVNIKADADGWRTFLVDGDKELAINDVMWTLPDLTTIEKFESINGTVMYGYYGLEFVPYGEFKAVEKQIEFKEVANIADLKNVENGTDIKLALNNTQVTVYEQARRGVSIYIEDETAGIQINDNDGTIFNEFGKTFNGYIYLKYVDENGVQNLETTSHTAKSEYTAEVKDVVAKEVALADATSANYNQKLIKVMNTELATKTITEGEGDDAYSYDIYVLTDGEKEMKLQDMFSKTYDENGDAIATGKYNVSGIIMSMPVYDANWTEVIGAEDYFIPTGEGFEEAAVADGRQWHFDAMGEADEALLAADTEHWSVSKNRFQNSGVAFNDEVIKVNDVELEVTKGLLFTAEANKLLLGSGINGSNHFMQVQKGSSFRVTDLAVGDTVRVEVCTSSKTAATLEAPATSVANIIEGFEAVTSKHICTFVMCEAGSIILKGDNADLRFYSLEVKAGNPNEVANLRKWDFTAWSEETKANMAADAATVVPTDNGDGTLTYPTVTPWRSYEKVNGPTEADPDREGNAYWYGTAISGAEELTANGTVIAETKGLLFNTMAAGALAAAINYPETTLGTYEGPAYLWIGGKNNSFTIPNVKSGSKITMGVESHKTTDARGVTLTIDGTEIGRAVPTTYDVFEITVPGELTDNVLSDVVITNTNGCHIYYINVDATGVVDGISDVKAEVKVINNNVYTINGVKVRNAGESLEGLAKGMYIIGGKKVVIK